MTITARPLRDYQELAVRHTIAKMTPGKRGYYVLPTGCGKTRIFSALVEYYAGMGRVLVVAHRKELIEQAATAISHDAPSLEVGIVMAERNEVSSPVVVASIQTLASEGRRESLLDSYHDIWHQEFLPDIVAVFFDECHHVTDSNTYKQLINEIAKRYPACRFIGCTATPFRSDKAAMQKVLSECTFTRSIPEMIKEQWLCPVVWRPLKLPLSLEKVNTSVTSEGKDFNAGQIYALYSPQSAFIAEHVKAMIETRPTVGFAASVDHAEQLSQACCEIGLKSAYIHGAMRKEERESLLLQWRRGDIQIMWNYGILTEGFDYVPIAPNNEGLAAVVVARATMSPSLYLQMIGRGTRLKPGAFKDVLIIDVAGNANLLETKQILLPKMMDVVSEEEIEEFDDEGHEPARKREKKEQKHAPFSVHLSDGQHISWLAWGMRQGCYFAQVGDDVLACLIPDPAGSGLWYARLITRKGWNYSWKEIIAPDHALTSQEAMQHVNLLVAKAGSRKLLDKDALWRSGKPSQKQLAVLPVKEREQAIAEEWTKGEVGHAISWKFYGAHVQKLQKKLEEQ